MIYEYTELSDGSLLLHGNVSGANSVDYPVMASATNGEPKYVKATVRKDNGTAYLRYDR